jgi:hypothetical protein
MCRPLPSYLTPFGVDQMMMNSNPPSSSVLSTSSRFNWSDKHTRIISSGLLKVKLCNIVTVWNPTFPPPNRWPLCKWFEQLEFFCFSKQNSLLSFLRVSFLLGWEWWLSPNQHLDGYQLLNTPPAGPVWILLFFKRIVSTWYWVFILEPSHYIWIQGLFLASMWKEYIKYIHD